MHVSVADPSLDSPHGYYRGTAEFEQAVFKSGLSYSVLRPTVIFGGEDILIDNIASFVRRLSLFGVPGSGNSGIRPIYVEDMARLIVDGVGKPGNEVVDAVGSETFTFDELVRLIAAQIGQPAWVVPLPAHWAYLSTPLAGLFLRDDIVPT